MFLNAQYKEKFQNALFINIIQKSRYTFLVHTDQIYIPERLNDWILYPSLRQEQLTYTNALYKR